MPIQMICANCENPFYCYPSEAEKGRKYCGLECRSAHRFKKDLLPSSRTPVHFTCRECAGPFTMMKSYLKAYRKKFKHDPLYCSMECSVIGKRKDTERRHSFTCLSCGTLRNNRRKPGGGIYPQQKFCDRACKAAYQRQVAHERFQRGDYKKHVKRHGYVWISIPALSSPTGKKIEMLEHRWVMSQHLGRPLGKEETVHHKDGNRAHNAIENLELFESRHGPGQRVTDRIQFAIEVLRKYPEFAREAGVVLHDIES